MILSLSANGWFIYGLPYLLLQPRWKCFFVDDGQELKGDEYNLYCNPSYFCDNKQIIIYEPDYNSPITLNNWMQEYKLECL